MAAPYTVVIAGGGTAGWMTAAALSHALPADRYRVHLVEAPDIATVGVGEATVPSIADFHALLGIDENAFVSAVGGTFKLGIEFVNWQAPGTRYFHPFGTHGLPLGQHSFLQYWLRHRSSQGEAGPSIEDYSMCAWAAREGKFMRPVDDPASPLSQLRYAYHLDAGRYAAFLAQYARTRDVTHHRAKILDVIREPSTGDIEALLLDTGQRLTGELFVDCTGFRALLIGRALEVGYEDWSHWLPCDRAIALPCERAATPAPYTLATARDAGWRWRIPLQHRKGNGHIYSSAFLSDDLALDDLVAGMEGVPAASPNMLRFTPGQRSVFWTGNCVAIGLSAGFIEPLESTSIHLIQEGIKKLIALMPDGPIAPSERTLYNRLMSGSFEVIRDFVIAHYCVTHRRDTPFWQYVSNMPIPDPLQDRLDLFRRRGRFFDTDEHLFKSNDWASVLLGQGLIPEAHDPLVAGMAMRELDGVMRQLYETYATAARHMPPHQVYVSRFCPAAG